MPQVASAISNIVSLKESEHMEALLFAIDILAMVILVRWSVRREADPKKSTHYGSSR